MFSPKLLSFAHESDAVERQIIAVDTPVYILYTQNGLAKVFNYYKNIYPVITIKLSDLDRRIYVGDYLLIDIVKEGERVFGVNPRFLRRPPRITKEERTSRSNVNKEARAIGNIMERVKYLEVQYEKYPDDKYILSDLITSYLKAHYADLEKVKTLVEKSVILDPLDNHVLANAGTFYYRNGSYDLAYDCFYKEYLLNPDNPITFCNVAKAEWGRGNIKNARAMFTEILNKYRGYTLAVFSYVQMELERDDLAAARKILTENYGFNKKEVKIINSFAQLSLREAELLSGEEKSRKKDEALSYFNDSLFINGNDEYALFWKGIILMNRFNYHEAEQLMLKILKLNPSNILGLKGLGRIAIKNGNDERALNYFVEVLRVRNDDEVAIFYVILIIFRKGYCQEALRLIEPHKERNDYFKELYIRMNKKQRSLHESSFFYVDNEGPEPEPEISFNELKISQ